MIKKFNRIILTIGLLSVADFTQADLSIQYKAVYPNATFSNTACSAQSVSYTQDATGAYSYSLSGVNCQAETHKCTLGSNTIPASIGQMNIANSTIFNITSVLQDTANKIPTNFTLSSPGTLTSSQLAGCSSVPTPTPTPIGSICSDNGSDPQSCATTPPIVIVNENVLSTTYLPGCVGFTNSTVNNCKQDRSKSIATEGYAIRFKFAAQASYIQINTSTLDTLANVTTDPTQRMFNAAVSTVPGDYTGTQLGSVCSSIGGESRIDAYAGDPQNPGALKGYCVLKPDTQYYINVKPVNPYCASTSGVRPSWCNVGILTNIH